jgi:hypothetical protein
MRSTSNFISGGTYAGLGKQRRCPSDFHSNRWVSSVPVTSHYRRMVLNKFTRSLGSCMRAASYIAAYSFLSAVAALVMSAGEVKLRLCLHFDINKSIIMTDVSSGRSMEQTLNSLLSECTWGVCDERPFSERTEKDWKWCHPEPCTDCPVPGAVTLGTYMEDMTPVPKKEQTKLNVHSQKMVAWDRCSDRTVLNWMLH